MASVVLGVFSEKNQAEDVISELESEGYNPKDMSIVMRDTSESREFSENTGIQDVANKTLGGAAIGTVVGGLAGLVAASIAPGLGVIFIGGPVASALGLTEAAATTVSGATTGLLAGGIIGALTSAFNLSKEDARRYEGRIKEGGILVAVPARQGEEEEIAVIMSDFDADNVKVVQSSERMTRGEENPSGAYGHAYFSEMRPKGKRANSESIKTRRGKKSSYRRS